MAGPDCFACNPNAARVVEAPWNWSAPRAACVSHKARLRLGDSQLLEDVLALVEPDGYPLEGSLLGWIYNPVLLDVDAGIAVTGWVDFVAGGMAVFEDRFGARSYFEFRAFESPSAVDLLHAIRLTGPLPDAMPEAQGYAILTGSVSVPPTVQRRGGLQEGWLGLVRAWNFQHHLSRVRDLAGCSWPRSYGELRNWFVGSFLDGDEIEPGTEASFTRELAALALRRFPVRQLTSP